MTGTKYELELSSSKYLRLSDPYPLFILKTSSIINTSTPSP